MQSQNTDFMDQAVSTAEESLAHGNYPVGAVLVIDGEVISVKGNTGESSKSYINHAETSLIIDHAESMLVAASIGKSIDLYSTLEPCLMCLGVAVMNKVSSITYAQKDPHAGACGIDVTSLGIRYSEVWPKITQQAESADRAKQLILQFLQDQIATGSRLDWSKRMIELFNKS